MDWPILKYLDILIGLAVVMILGTTVVAAVTQLLLSSLYFRARTLRQGLEELIRQLDPAQLTAADSRLVAQMLLRHPLLARPRNKAVALFLNTLPNLIRQLFHRAPLPAASNADVIQRSELVMLLLEWASGDGLPAQDTTLPKDAAAGLKRKLLQVLVNNGIGDPAGVLSKVRLQAIENEKNAPTDPAHTWWNRALMQEAATDFLGKINQGFDNAMTRVSQAFRLKANFVACVISFVVAFSIQLDALSLLKRLSVDDKLRDSLVKEAEMITTRIENAEKEAKAKPEATAPAKPAAAPAAKPEVKPEAKPDGAPPAKPEASSDEKERAKQDAEKARAARDEIDATLALMREPRFAIIPDTLYWDKLAQDQFCPDTSQGGQGTWKGALTVGLQTYSLAARQPLTVETLERAIADVKAPVYLYPIEDSGRKCLLIVARSPAVSAAALMLTSPQGESLLKNQHLGRDGEGARRRLPGVLLSWVLLSLGTPFWFNLLKNLLSLRSALARKDDKERSDRENQITPPKTGAPEAAPPPPSKPSRPAERETGELDATGAVG